MNLLLTGTMFWQNRTYNRGDLVTVQDRGLGWALLASGKAIAADPETQREYQRLFEPAAPVPLRTVPARARPGAKPDKNGFYPWGSIYAR